ncbi:MAG: hypothetical protein CL916_14785 [Deltaproteobacteria bacterium]|nr:hypothetical protein [Deltaproteobacteria bacterium]
MGRGVIHLEWISEDIALLRLDNPQARNAMSHIMMLQLEQHCFEIIEKARVVILSSTGTKSFCAGGDLQDVRNALLSKASAQEMNTRMSNSLGAFREHNIYTIVALNGPAVGGGAELTTYGDVVFAHPDSFIAFVHAKLGVSPGWGGAMRLLEKVGIHRARQLLVLAQKITAQQALNIGLIDEISQEPQNDAVMLAKKLMDYPRESIDEILSWCTDPSSDREKDLFLSLWGGESHRKALGIL